MKHHPKFSNLLFHETTNLCISEMPPNINVYRSIVIWNNLIFRGHFGTFYGSILGHSFAMLSWILKSNIDRYFGYLIMAFCSELNSTHLGCLLPVHMHCNSSIPVQQSWTYCSTNKAGKPVQNMGETFGCLLLNESSFLLCSYPLSFVKDSFSTIYEFWIKCCINQSGITCVCQRLQESLNRKHLYDFITNLWSRKLVVL